MLILISGGSCAGKTTFSAALHEALNQHGVHSLALSTDLFYTDIPAGEPLREHDFDAEQSVDAGLMHRICSSYESGISSFPVFEFRTHARSGMLEVPPVPVLLLEGIFALSFPSITALPSLKICIRTEAAERYRRRHEFYSHTLGHTDEFIDFKFYEQAEPYYQASIAPWEHRADIVLSGEDDFGPGIEDILRRYF